MAHVRVSGEYIHFSLIYKTDHIFPVLSIKHLVNQDIEPTTPHKMATDTTPSVSSIPILFCTCVVRNSTSHVGTKALNMRHQSQKVFQGILVGITQHQKEYLIYIPSTHITFYSHDVIHKKNFLVY